MNVGQILLGRYRLDNEIDAGTSGTVWRATDVASGRVVAIKALHPHLRRDPEYARRFRSEARVGIDHPRVVQVIDDGAEGDDVFIVMEFVEGQTLADAAKRPMEPQRALAIVRDIAEALYVAHAKGVTHRDVKPRNVLLDRDGRAKLSDFGIARLADATTFTMTGMFLGTASYAAPETFRGRADERSDLYSLGIVLYELILGEPPFPGPTPGEVMQQHMGEAPPRLAEIVRRDARAGWIVKQLLEKEPDDRFQSARALLGAIDGDATTAPLGRQARKPRRAPLFAGIGGRWKYAAAALVGLLAVGSAVTMSSFAASGGGDGGGSRRVTPTTEPTLSVDATATTLAAYGHAIETQEAGQTQTAVAALTATPTDSAGGTGVPPTRTPVPPTPVTPTRTPVLPTPVPTQPLGSCAGSDFDKDGLCDTADVCPGTPTGWLPVDGAGCAQLQVDFDADGVCDAGRESPGPQNCTGSDLCPGTPTGWQPVDGAGCAQLQVDFDADGVCDAGRESPGPQNCTGSDLCPGTPAGWQPVDGAGCAQLQVDFDADGVCDASRESPGPQNCTGSDLCPGTPAAWRPVDSNGCASQQL